MADNKSSYVPERDSKETQTTATTEYCDRLQQWMWQYYCCSVGWQNCMMPMTPLAFPPTYTGAQTPSGGGQEVFDVRNLYGYAYPLIPPPSSPPTTNVQGVHRRNSNPSRGREYTIPSPMLRFLAETVDFFILFCVKATILLWIMHLSGMKDIAKFVTHFIVEEIDENTSFEDLQKMMAVALVYRTLVCFYETVCIWGAGGATPGKFLFGLRVVSCDTSSLVQPNRVLVVPASHVSLSSSAVRALNKNFSIAFFFPVFITLLFFQHNRTVYDVVAGTIVVQSRRTR